MAGSSHERSKVRTAKVGCVGPPDRRIGGSTAIRSIIGDRTLVEVRKRFGRSPVQYPMDGNALDIMIGIHSPSRVHINAMLRSTDSDALGSVHPVQ